MPRTVGPPLTGQGTAMALTGGYVLATELAARSPGDVRGALTPDGMLTIRAALTANRMISSQPVAGLVRRLAARGGPERIDLPVVPTTGSAARS